MFLERLLQPIKAKVGGRGGFKHTLAHFSLNEQGQPGIRLACGKSGCGCYAHYSIEEILKASEEFKRESGGNNGKQASSEDWAA